MTSTASTPTTTARRANTTAATSAPNAPKKHACRARPAPLKIALRTLGATAPRRAPLFFFQPSPRGVEGHFATADLSHDPREHIIFSWPSPLVGEGAHSAAQQRTCGRKGGRTSGRS